MKLGTLILLSMVTALVTNCLWDVFHMERRRRRLARDAARKLREVKTRGIFRAP